MIWVYPHDGMKVRIGVTSTSTLCEEREIHATNRVYSDALVRAGALPLLLPVLDGSDAEEVVAGLDGLVLSGGGDMAAWCYGEDAAPEAYGVDTERDAWELALVEAASAIDLPILGICRGAQVINVAGGGTLFQHLPAISDECHRVLDQPREPVHAVRVEIASLLFDITRRRKFGVNSLHHQSVGRVGSGLRAVAWSPDGVVEAIESSLGRPMLGVQWHPELLGDQANSALFAWLAREAVNFRCVSAPTLFTSAGHHAATVPMEVGAA
jgi:putative glutamine amidotransferase